MKSQKFVSHEEAEVPLYLRAATSDRLFPIYLIISTLGLFVCSGSVRFMIDGADEIVEPHEDGSLHRFSWVWGFMCGFCRINPACAALLSMCSISLSFYAKHKSMNETSAKQAPLSQVEASYFSHCLPAFDEETDMDGNNNPDNGNDSPDNNNYFSDEDEENNQMQHLVASCCTPVACKKWFHSVPHVVAIHTVLIVVVVMVIALLASMLPSRGWHFASLFFYAGEYHSVSAGHSLLTHSCSHASLKMRTNLASLGALQSRQLRSLTKR